MSDNKEISGWRKEFKDAWFAANDTGLLPKKKVKELWETTERAADIAYKYIRNHIEARHHLSPVAEILQEAVNEHLKEKERLKMEYPKSAAVIEEAVKPWVHKAIKALSGEHPSSLRGDAVKDDYWQKRCEAAELYLSTMRELRTDENDNAYNVWQSLARKQKDQCPEPNHSPVVINEIPGDEDH